MRVVTVARAPLGSSTTTDNVVEHEAGSLNIDGTRLGSGGGGGDREGEATKETRYTEKGSTNFAPLPGPRGGDAQGRWPANVMLQHRPGCRKAGTVTAQGYQINRWSDGAKPFGGGAGHEYDTEVFPDEEVELWECQDDCPIQGLKLYVEDVHLVARYFKQTQETTMGFLPENMIQYLTTLISPPPSCDPNVLVAFDLDEVAWGEMADSSVHGMITQGNPEPHMEEIDRVLRPGAHLLVVAPDDEPTGDSGACAVEDFGYEIRDAILILDDPEGFHYTAKASSSERNSGVSPTTLPNQKVVYNYHPTVKPVAVMEALLKSVPTGGLVVDPFMGSGTTAVACLRTGHSIIGIDLEEDHVRIATERVNHWDSATCSWDAADIVSEVTISDKEEEAVGLDDFFGM